MTEQRNGTKPVIHKLHWTRIRIFKFQGECICGEWDSGEPKIFMYDVTRAFVAHCRDKGIEKVILNYYTECPGCGSADIHINATLRIPSWICFNKACRFSEWVDYAL